MLTVLAKAMSLAVIVHSPCPIVDAEGWPPACVEPPNIVYVGDGVDRGTLHHEFGHVVDLMLLTDADRGRFRVYASRPRPWYWPDLPYPHVWWGEPNPFGEQFAEAVRMCARSMRYPDRSWGGFNWVPTVGTHRRVCRWLAELP